MIKVLMLLAVAALLALSLATFLFLYPDSTTLFTRIGVSLLLIVFCLLVGIIITTLMADRRVSRQQRSEKDLRTERDFNQAVLNTVNAFVVVFDRQFRITFLNRHGEEESGYSQAEVFGRHLWDFLLPPPESKQVQTVFEKLFLVPACFFKAHAIFSAENY